VIDHQNVYRACGRLEPKAELLLEGGANRWPGGGVRQLVRRIWPYRIWESGESIVNGELQVKSESSGETAFVNDFPA